MFFNSLALPKLIVMLSVSCLLACAAKQAKVELDPAHETARIQMQKETEQFNYALGLIQSENAQEKQLLQAKDILDSLYARNPAYLGALINSADISLKLKKLDEAKALYLDAIQNIDRQKMMVPEETKQTEAANVKHNVSTQPVVSEHINSFTLHAQNQLGLIARQQGNFDKAETQYRQALAVDSGNPTTIKNLAILLDLYRGKLTEALALYEQYQSIVGDSDPKIKDWIYDLKNRLPAEEASNE